MTDYEFYLVCYRGNSIEVEDFARLAARAEDFLAFLEREYAVAGDETARSKAICALAEAAQATEKAASASLSGDIVASESVGSVSVSYRPVSASDAGLDLSAAGTQRRYYDIARRYLTIYRGVR